jgi:hypothetical protein
MKKPWLNAVRISKTKPLPNVRFLGQKQLQRADSLFAAFLRTFSGAGAANQTASAMTLVLQ